MNAIPSHDVPRRQRLRGERADRPTVSLVVRENQFVHNVEASAVEEIERDRCDCRKTRVGDEVGDGDAGGARAAGPCCGYYFGTNPGQKIAT